MRAQSLSHVRLCDPMDCSPPGSSVQGISQARILEWVAISFSKEVNFHSNQKEGSAKEWSNYCTTAVVSHASKIMLKILQGRLQEYVNCKLPDVQAGLRKRRETRDQTAYICWITEKAKKFQKNIYFHFVVYAKV